MAVFLLLLRFGTTTGTDIVLSYEASGLGAAHTTGRAQDPDGAGQCRLRKGHHWDGGVFDATRLGRMAGDRLGQRRKGDGRNLREGRGCEKVPKCVNRMFEQLNSRCSEKSSCAVHRPYKL